METLKFTVLFFVVVAAALGLVFLVSEAIDTGGSSGRDHLLPMPETREVCGYVDINGREEYYCDLIEVR